MILYAFKNCYVFANIRALHHFILQYIYSNYKVVLYQGFKVLLVYNVTGFTNFLKIITGFLIFRYLKGELYYQIQRKHELMAFKVRIN